MSAPSPKFYWGSVRVPRWLYVLAFGQPKIVEPKREVWSWNTQTQEGDAPDDDV